jgi:hypothetical protein
VKKDYQKKTAPVVTGAELVLPDAVSVAMADIAGAVRMSRSSTNLGTSSGSDLGPDCSLVTARTANNGRHRQPPQGHLHRDNGSVQAICRLNVFDVEPRQGIEPWTFSLRVPPARP